MTLTLPDDELCCWLSPAPVVHSILCCFSASRTLVVLCVEVGTKVVAVSSTALVVVAQSTGELLYRTPPLTL